jgi:hypothetical protein
MLRRYLIPASRLMGSLLKAVENMSDAYTLELLCVISGASSVVI